MSKAVAKRILFIQHTGIAYSGSARSLLYTMAGLDRERYQPIVALIRPCLPLIDLYQEAGIESIAWPGIGTFEHTTLHSCSPTHPMCWQHQAQLVKGWRRSRERTAALVAHVRPDLVHLNSAVLMQAALAVEELGLPLVWHVREAPDKGSFGLRYQWMVNAMKRAANEVIFISEADRRAWVGDGFGQVVLNFVDLVEFDKARGTGANTRKALGIAADAPVIAYLGGVGEVKGYLVLLEALALLRPQFPGIRCIMPGSVYPPPSNWKSAVARKVLPVVGSGTLGQKAESLIRKHRLDDVCLRMPGVESVAGLLAASDILTFPALAPHFARPVIEAAVMGLPTVASDLDGPRELILAGETGTLVPPNDARALAQGLAELLMDDDKRRRMGTRAQSWACEQFDARRGVRKIEAVYERIFGEEPPSAKNATR